MKILIICSKKFYKDIQNFKAKLEKKHIEGFSPIVINENLDLIK